MVNFNENYSNGFGFGVNLGQNEIKKSGFDQVKLIFLEANLILDSLFDQNFLRLEGQPGCGKSEMINLLFTESSNQSNDYNVFKLVTHINGGKKDGIENIKEPFEKFLKNCQNIGGLMLIDNIDYLGYKGHRSVASAKYYSQELAILMNQVFDCSNLKCLATSHCEDWRQSHWLWANEHQSINQISQTIIDKFPAVFNYQGNISEDSFCEQLQSKGFTIKKIEFLLGSLRLLKHPLNHLLVKYLEPSYSLDSLFDVKNKLKYIETGQFLRTYGYSREVLDT